MLSIATIVASRGTSQFTKYFEDTREVEKFVRADSDLSIWRQEKQEPSQESREELFLAPREEKVVLRSEAAGKFQDLQFRPKVKARDRPKRSQRQLCSFNRTVTDREASGAPRQGTKHRVTTAVPGPKKRQRRFIHHCPVCAAAIEESESGVITTECCGLLVHSACFGEVDDCPDCSR